MEANVAVNLSIKNVPDALADNLRARAARNHRSLQRELLSILTAVVEQRVPAVAQPLVRGGALSIEEAAARAQLLFPGGTPDSVDIIRSLRDGR